jgi:hypothetical protein
LKSVDIPDSVTTIGNCAFWNCSGLTSVIIPSSVTLILNYAFRGCAGLQQITSLATTPPTIYEETFPDYSVPLIAVSEAYKTADYWKNFTNITVDANVTVGGDVVSKELIGDIYYDIDGSVATVVGCSYSVTELNIPEEITYNGHTYPVLEIGSRAFEDHTGLISVTIPASVTKIGVYAFSGCTALTSVEIPNSVTWIGGYAFSGCTGLTSVALPAAVTSIEFFVFYGCTSLTEVTIPDSVTSIGVEAFEDCIGLTSVNIPNSVTKIGSSAFYNCTGLTSVTIGNSVTTIGSYAFFGCALTSVTIPYSVTSIGNKAFYACSGLTSVTCLWNEPLSAANNVFSNSTYENCTLNVPVGTSTAYANVDPWSNFSQINEVEFDAINAIGEDSNAPFRVEAGAICVSGDTDVRIVSGNGTTIYNGRGETRINLVRGIYIVIVNNTATKVAVK